MNVEKITYAMEVIRQKMAEIEEEFKFGSIGSMSIDQLDLDEKIKDCLKEKGILTVLYLNERAHSPTNCGLNKYKGFGEVRIVKVMIALHKVGLRVDDCVMSPSMRSRFETALDDLKKSS